MSADGSASARDRAAAGAAPVAVDYDPFAAGGEIQRTVASTESQRELWLADMQGRGSSLAFNESVELRLAGALDVGAMRAALAALVERHEALRSTFSADGLTLNVNAPPASLPVPLDDLAALDERAQQTQLGQIRQRQVDEPFDLVAGPLFRAEIVRTGADRHTVFMTAHHIVCDGWSFGVLVKDLAAAYARARGVAADWPAPERYSDYAQAERQRESAPETAEHERFWVERFAASLPPPLELPGDHARPAVRGTASDRIDHELPASLVKAVKQLGARNGSSFVATMTAGFAGLMSRLSGQTDLVVGIPTAGQAAGGHDRLVGHCVNMMPLRIAVDPQAGFGALIKSVRGALLDATEHQALTFGALLKKLPLPRDPSRLPLMTVVFNVDQTIPPEAAVFPGLTWQLYAVPRTHETFELFVNAVEHPGGMRVETQYSRDLFDAATVRRWLASLETLLAAAVAGAATSFGLLEIASADERATITRFNATEAAYPRGVRAEALISAQAARTPEKVAVISGGASLRYGELEARANRLARCLRKRGVGRGTLVGISLERSSDMLAAMLAVMKTGGTYVPLDPSYPAARLALMTQDSKMSVIVARREIAAGLGFDAARTLSPDADATEIAGESADSPPALDPPAGAEDAAYVIYTSGSTGKPKGVRVPHRALVNFLTSMQREPGLGADDRLLAVTTLSFDIAELELLLPLTVGAAVVLASQDEATDGVALRKLLESSGATVMQATPASWRMLIEAGWKGGPRFRALCGGEPMRPDLAQALLARTGELWNMYGPTETTVWSTCWRVHDPGRGIWIGRPIANTQVHVLDERMAPCPIGVPGEVFIAGDGVALGYLDRPELTTERFVTDPFAGGGARMYRTGDLGRWRADGQLECLGRTDHQVKIRGYRIELGEIESALATLPAISRVVAMAREDRPGDVRLVAYLVLAGGAAAAAPADSDLRRHLGKTLPEYMIPAHFVTLAAMPLLPNGKIDRHKLPPPSGEVRPAGAEFVAPRNAIETTVAGVFQDLLAVARVGVHDNFFLLGGHSLLAAQGAARLSQAVGHPVSMRTLFEAPTVAALAERLGGSSPPSNGKAAAAVAAPAAAAGAHEPTVPLVIPRRADRRRAILSLMQQRLWFLEELQPGRIVYNVPSAHRLFGALDEAAFQRAFDEMVRRQDILRTVLGIQDGSPYQEVLPELASPLFPAEDLSALAHDERERVLAERLKEDVDRPFELTRIPLFRARLFKMAPEEHVFELVLHHAIWDGWSFDLLYEEMGAHYEAFQSGKPSPLPPLTVNYGDFAAWHREWMQGDELARQVSYWKKNLAGTLQPLALPSDRPRPAVATEEGSTVWIALEAERVNALRDLGQRADATVFMTLLAAYYVLLHRLTGQRDLIVGIPVRGRAHVELEKVMGFFVNALPLRFQIDPQESFVDLVRRLRPFLLDAFSHQDVPFEHLVHELRVPRDESRAPIAQAFFSYQDVRHRPRNWGNLRHGRYDLFPHAAGQDVSLWFVEGRQGLIGGLNFATDLFDDATAELFGSRFTTLLKTAVALADRPVGELPFATDEESAQVRQWNATDAGYPRGVRVEALIEEQSRRAPDRSAISFAGSSTSYRDLDARANQLAHCLRKRGVGRGVLVGIALERSADMVASVLAVMKAGGTYVPLDPSYPPARLALMVEDSKMAVLIARRDDAADLGFDPARTLAPDADGAEIAAASKDPPPPLPDAPGAEDAAYVIYTSGSTGKPKGVRVPHRGVVNFLASMRAQPGLAEGDRLLAVTTLSFDIAVLELLLPLTVGAEIVLASLDDATDGVALAKLLADSRATVMQATPATWRMLIEAGWRGGPRFRALCGGEALAPDLAAALLERTGQLWNMYGPTETTVWSTCWRVVHPENGIWIGRPIANTQVWVLDEQGRSCPIGVPGEIYIAGDGVALGYLNRPELTDERFVPDPFAGGAARMYRTGDLGRWRWDGVLECLGRTDFQVKVRGYRIELGEIETTLSTHPAVAQAVVVARPGPGGEKQLVAYLITRDGESPTGSELRKHARQKLPDYMVPPTYVTVDAFPLTPNGKIDRRALPEPQAIAPAEADAAAVAPSTPNELALAEVWAQLLGVKSVSAGDNFFDLGGHSLLVMQAIAAMEKRVGRRLGPRPFIFGTLAQVAAAYDGAAPANTPPPPAPVAPDRGGGLLKGIFSRLGKS